MTRGANRPTGRASHASGHRWGERRERFEELRQVIAEGLRLLEQHRVATARNEPDLRAANPGEEAKGDLRGRDAVLLTPDEQGGAPDLAETIVYVVASS